MKRRKEIYTDEEEKELKEKLRLNSNYFQNNFVKASWIPNELLTDLRNWHSPMIREWTYRGHTRAGQSVGLNECLPRRYNFVDIMRSSRTASSLPPSFHRMPDLSPDETARLRNRANKELHELLLFAKNIEISPNQLIQDITQMSAPIKKRIDRIRRSKPPLHA